MRGPIREPDGGRVLGLTAERQLQDARNLGTPRASTHALRTLSLNFDSGVEAGVNKLSNPVGETAVVGAIECESPFGAGLGGAFCA